MIQAAEKGQEPTAMFCHLKEGAPGLHSAKAEAAEAQKKDQYLPQAVAEEVIPGGTPGKD